MGRRGYEVWLVPDLGGSWEQSPSNLLDELQRDRRWCQGNLQNLRLVAEPGWRPAHRMMFSVGALSYLVAPLWLLFMVLGLGGGSMLGRDLSLWLLTLALLILPRALGVVVIAARGEAAAFGGTVRLSIGAVIELLMSTHAGTDPHAGALPVRAGRAHRPEARMEVAAARRRGGGLARCRRAAWAR